MADAASATQADPSGDYDLDVQHTRLGFVARHAMVTKVRGSFHQFEGTLHIDAADPTKSSGEVRIVADSIDTGVGQRDDHLRSNDFFDMPTYPEIKFVSTSVSPSGDDTYTVTGDLTIKDVTKPVSLDVEYTGSAVDPFGNTRIGFEASATVNRKDWGVNWNAPLEAGGVLVGDKVVLTVDISAIKRAGTGGS